MGFLDKIFKPKWKHEDSFVRYKAAEKLKNQKTLIHLAQCDPNRDVRIVAIKKINDRKVLFKMYNNMPYSSVNSEYRAISERYHYIIKEDANRLNNVDESVLIDIAKNDSDDNFRAEVVKKITDESVLIDFAQHDSYENVRIAAVNNPNLKNDSVLVDIFKNDDESLVRTEALKNITDQSVLIDIAKNELLNAYTLDNYNEIKYKITDKQASDNLDKILNDNWIKPYTCYCGSTDLAPGEYVKLANEVYDWGYKCRRCGRIYREYEMKDYKRIDY